MWIDSRFRPCSGHRLSSGILILAVWLFAAPNLLRAAVANKVDPQLESIPDAALHFDGFVGDRLAANLDSWELRAPKSNPALVEMFYDRDREPSRKLLPWSGEFVGKYLCAAILSYRILRDPRQKATIQSIVQSLIASQGSDGYLGPFNKEVRLTGRLPEWDCVWDTWGHYWVIRGLLAYYQEFGDPAALNAAEGAADLILNTFLDNGIPMTNDGGYGQMNYAIIHAYALLYRITGKPEYLKMANWIVHQWDEPGAGLYMRLALAGKDMSEFPGNRWESVHDFLGMYEMYLLTGDAKYRVAFTDIWYSILKGDRHNTGGFTSGEHTTGNPYDPNPIETCCTVAWIDMTIDMLKLTGDSRVADELELSTFNGNIGGQSPSGSWWTYNTPMDGEKVAAVQTINFQCRPGSPELNCCSVNGPRGLGMIADWAIMRSKDGLTINYYGPSNFEAATPSGQRIKVSEETSYPVKGQLTIKIKLPSSEKFALRLRVPSWSLKTSASLNGQALQGVTAGSYATLDRQWKDGDTISLNLDMSAHYWAGEREQDGKSSVYRGPVLLAFDPVYNSKGPGEIPQLDARSLDWELDNTSRSIQPWVLLRTRAVDGSEIRLCDFASAGAYGNPYKTWLRIRNVSPIRYDLNHPAWNNRP
jgi:DUF1680 family protein